ncbi:MAG: SiaB family protein kinase [Bacteroidota bacterium]
MKNVDYMKLVYEFHQEMLNNKFTLVYEGEITHQITKAFTSLAENKMDSYSEDASMKKKVFHVMVECLQNLSKHAEEYESAEGKGFVGNGIFIVGRLGEDNANYHVMTGNAVENNKVGDLKALLEKINQLDKDGLKELFKKQMREGSLSEKGGAGLGLIDIARKTGEKLEYNFIEIDSNTSFFLLRTIISRK